MPPSTLQNWSDRLRGAALATLGSESLDAMANLQSGELKQLPMAQLIGTSLGVKTHTLGRESRSLDERLWRSLADQSIKPPPCHSLIGPLTGENKSGAIEVWTETELACVHAAWSLGDDWRTAAKASATWLLENIQPDNATNHPWAVHVFASLAVETGNFEFDLYAQSLLHNCIVGTGKPDAFSAIILLHASRAIQAG